MQRDILLLFIGALISMVTSTDTINNNVETTYYGDEKRYSFIIPSESIKEFELLFTMKEINCPNKFDELRIVFFDQRNQRKEIKLMDISNSWQIISYETDDGWSKIIEYR